MSPEQIHARHLETQRLCDLAAQCQALAVISAVRCANEMLDQTDLSPEAEEWRGIYTAVAELGIDIAKIHEADPDKIFAACELLSIIADPHKESIPGSF